VSELRWSGTPDRAARYAARFAALAAGGADVHGEATFCAALLAPGARVLDAGCGTGRLAIRLAELGWDCVGVDNDPHMLALAQAASIGASRSGASGTVRWVLGDLAAPNLGGVGGQFDLVVAAGNVIPLVVPGTEAAVVANLAAALKPAAPLVTGFGLDTAHLPLKAAPFGLAEYDGWCAAAGLTLIERFAGWDRAGDNRRGSGSGGSDSVGYDGGGYAVSVHRRTA
jgi:SAM-dependent methyltransferase